MNYLAAFLALATSVGAFASAADGFPKGTIAEGTLMWHPKTKEWIIGLEAGDRDAVEVGGCSDGPEVVDLKKRIFWTC